MSKSIYHFFLRLPSILPVLFLTLVLAAYSANGNSETKTDANNVSSSKDESLQTVPFISLRNRSGSDDASEFFGGERGAMSAGYCDLSNTSLSSLKAITEKMPFYIPEDIVSLDAVRESIPGNSGKT